MFRSSHYSSSLFRYTVYTVKTGVFLSGSECVPSDMYQVYWWQHGECLFGDAFIFAVRRCKKASLWLTRPLLLQSISEFCGSGSNLLLQPWSCPETCSSLDLKHTECGYENTDALRHWLFMIQFVSWKPRVARLSDLPWSLGDCGATSSCSFPS